MTVQCLQIDDALHLTPLDPESAAEACRQAGMNFENMPELKSSIGYPLALGFMALVGTAMFFLFRRGDGSIKIGIRAGMSITAEDGRRISA